MYIYRTFNCGRIFFPQKTQLVKGVPGYKHGNTGDAPVFRSLEFHQFHQGVTVGLPALAFWRGDLVMWSRGVVEIRPDFFVGDCGYWNTVYDLSNCKWSIIKVLIRSNIASYSNSNLVNGLFCQIHVEDAYYKCVLQGHMKALSSPHTIILGVWVVKFCNKQRYQHFDTFLIHYSALLLSILTAARDCSVPWNVSLCSCRCLHWGVGTLFERECYWEHSKWF